jgi:cell division protein FtsL
LELGWLEKLKDRPELVFALIVIVLMWRIIIKLMDELTLLRKCIADNTEISKEGTRIQGSNVQILDYLLRRRGGE